MALAKHSQYAANHQRANLSGWPVGKKRKVEDFRKFV
jgi:hypothetical protein